MTKPTPHGQVPKALRLAEQYDHGDPAAHGNAWKAAVCTELRRLAELEAQIEALSGVQALSAAPTTSFEKVLSAYLTEDGFIAADDIPSICNDFARLLVVMKSAVRWAPSSAYWSEQLRSYFGEDARDGIEALEAQLRAALAASPTPPAEQQAGPGAVDRTGCTAGTDEECTRRGCATSCPAQQAAPKAVPVTQQAGYAEVIECGNSYAKVKLKGEAFGSTRVGDIFYTAPQQEVQEPCQTCVALARTVMLDQVSFDRKPDCYGIRHITDDEGIEEWEDIRTSPDVAREEANDMMATGRGEIYEVVPLWTTPQHAPQPAPGVGNSGFDHKTAADFLNGKTVSDEAVRKFVAASRWAHDEKAALSATLLAMHGVLTSREAEIALLKKALLEADTAPQPSPAPLSDDDLVELGKSEKSGLHPWGIGTTRADYLRAVRAVLDAARKQGANHD